MKNKIIVVLLLVGLLLFGWMQMIYLPGQGKLLEEESFKQLNPETHDFEKVLRYENLYMGNASNNFNLFGNLPLVQYLGTFEMDPDRFLLIVHYQDPIDESERTVQQSVIYNSTAAFVLIQNLQQLEMRFPEDTYTVHRSDVEKWFGSDLSELSDPVKFKEQVQEPLKKDDLEVWLGAYTK